MSYRPIFIFESGERCGNAQVFATRDEALDSASARFSVWTMPVGFDVEETSNPANYRVDCVQGDVRLTEVV